jgi:phosphatidylglycerol:prolipoprotein diacylglycerol transferase
MIPWFELHTIALGPIKIQVWGTLVALGFVAATWVAAKRAKAKGIDSNHLWNMAPWILIASFVCARLFHVFFYDPTWFWVHPIDVFNPTIPGYSMMGGVLGGFIAGLIYIRRQKLHFWEIADIVAYALPLGTGVGRIGCFLIHDHPGTLTHFVLGVKYPDGVRHDHGLYLSLLGWAMFLLFYILGHKKRPSGYFAGLWLIIDGAVRFFLDFYRIGDTRYAGLTPTQWLLIATVAVGVVILIKFNNRYGSSRQN